MQPAPRATRVLIVGGGFGGLYAAAYLGRSELRERGARVTLLDRKNYFTFTPLLAEVAAGTLGQEHVTYPYRALGRRHGFEFVQAAASGLDLEAQCVYTERGPIPFDYLVLAVGAAPQYFGNAELERQSLPFTSVSDALAIRNRVIASLERAATTPDERECECLLSFVVAGAGPAGVEVASEIHHLANETVRPFYPDLPPARVILVNGGDRILNGWDEDLARAGLARLRQRGIEVRLHTQIRSAAPGRVAADGPDGADTIAAHTLVWTAGTAPAEWASTLPLPVERGALKVNRFLQVEGQDNIFAVGDVTTLVDERAGHAYPRVAPIAISQGVRAAGNIENHALGRPLEPYHAHHAGKIISLGGGVALADILGIRLGGLLAWWIYRATYLLKLVGTKNKVRVLTTLLLNQLFEPDVASEEVCSDAGAS